MVKKLLDTEALHTMYQRAILLDVEAKVEERLFAASGRLASDAGYHVDQLAHEHILHEGGRWICAGLSRGCLTVAPALSLLRTLISQKVLVHLVKEPVNKLM